MTKSRGPRSFRPANQLRSFLLLLLGEMFSLRLEWFWYIAQVSFVPLTYLVFVRLLWSDPGSVVYAVAGGLVTSVSMSAMLSLGQYIGVLKESHAYEHYAALPISIRTFIAAIATRGVILSLPSLIVVMIIGRFLLGVELPIAAVIILLLGAYAMSGLGALIGFWSSTGETASLLTQVAQTVIIFFAPIFVPVSRLPQFLQHSASLMPTSYVAHALRAAMAGQPVNTYSTDIAVLVGFTVISLGLAPLRLQWRQR